MIELAFAAAILATGLLVAVYSPLFDEAFLDAVDDHRRFNGRRRPSSPKSA
jgi:hypothetical protein